MNFYIYLLIIICVIVLIFIIKENKIEKFNLIDTDSQAMRDFKNFFGDGGLGKVKGFFDDIKNKIDSSGDLIKQEFEKVGREIKKFFTETIFPSCYNDHAQCWRTEGGRSVYVGNTDNIIPYRCTAGFSGAQIRLNQMAVDWKDARACESKFPDKCNRDNGCWMQNK